MTAASKPTNSFRRYPLTALAKAEYLQFRRNKTLVGMGIFFPVGVSLLMYFITIKSDAPTTIGAATALELVALTALLFVQYYSVLSMVTTRRSEGVLKRLRTGEAADWQILTAPGVPGALVTLATASVVIVVVYGTGAPAPVNPLTIGLAFICGIILFTLLALATSAITKNAEAAQITALPVMTLTILGLMSIRDVLPDHVARLADWTPFAAISDLIFLGASGNPVIGDPSDAALDFMGTFGQVGRPFATLVVWIVLAFTLTHKSFRWDDRG